MSVRVQAGNQIIPGISNRTILSTGNKLPTEIIEKKPKSRGQPQL